MKEREKKKKEEGLSRYRWVVGLLGGGFRRLSPIRTGPAGGTLVMKGDYGGTMMHDVCEVCGYLYPSLVTRRARALGEEGFGVASGGGRR